MSHPARSQGGPPRRTRRATVGAGARPATALPALAPVVLVVTLALPLEWPGHVALVLAGLALTAMLVVAARGRRPVTEGAKGEEDPALIASHRWLATGWPGAAGVGAAGWWAARAGAAGLLARLAFGVLGTSGAAWPAAIVVAGLAGALGARRVAAVAARAVAPVALALALATGWLVSLSGLVSWAQGRLHGPPPTGGRVPSSGLAGPLAAVAVVCALGCLAASCVPAFRHRSSGPGRPRASYRALTLAALAPWLVGLPLLAARAGLSAHMEAARGTAGALRHVFTLLLWPVAGRAAPGAAGAVICVACLSAALAAMANSVGLARGALAQATVAQAASSGDTSDRGEATAGGDATSGGIPAGPAAPGLASGRSVDLSARSLKALDLSARAAAALDLSTRAVDTPDRAAAAVDIPDRGDRRSQARHGSTAPGSRRGLDLRAWLPAVVTGLAAALAAGTGARPWVLAALGGMAAVALSLEALIAAASHRGATAGRVATAGLAVRRPANARRATRRGPGTAPVVGLGAALTGALAACLATGHQGPAAILSAAAIALAGALALGARAGGLSRPLGPAQPPGQPALVPTAAPGRRPAWVPWPEILVGALAAVALAALLGPEPSRHNVLTAAAAAAVAGAGVAGAAVVPATRRRRTSNLTAAAELLARQCLPPLAASLESLAAGEPGYDAMSGLAGLDRARRGLEAAAAGGDGGYGTDRLAAALAEVAAAVGRLGVAAEAAAREDARRREGLLDERLLALSHANRRLVDSEWRRRQLLDRTVQVAEGERARIAANLHDGPIQRLAAIGLVLDRCRLRSERGDDAGARELAKRARSELSGEIDGLRRMMSELRPPVLDEGGLDVALRDHVSAWSAANGIEARLEVGPYRRLSANGELVVYRVVQEALANVAKHAKARLTTVTLTESGGGVRVVVRDDGHGFEAPPQPELLRHGHFGLVVMRERVELAAGRFELLSTPLSGTEINFWVPAATASEPMEAL